MWRWTATYTIGKKNLMLLIFLLFCSTVHYALLSNCYLLFISCSMFLGVFPCVIGCIWSDIKKPWKTSSLNIREVSDLCTKECRQQCFSMAVISFNSLLKFENSKTYLNIEGKAAAFTSVRHSTLFYSRTSISWKNTSVYTLPLWGGEWMYWDMGGN